MANAEPFASYWRRRIHLPITHISVLEAEAGYGVGVKIYESETEVGAAAIGDALNPKAIKEVVVLAVEGLTSIFWAD